jgi:2-oxoisovalerate dehydrogenase E2 component (dihydrolipoyl transacylase)
MPTQNQFRLPDVGEGLTEAEIVRWLVSVGDQVEVNQAIAEIETAKSLVELPSPFAGRVAGLHAEPGDVVEVGQPIVSITTADAATPEPEPRLLVGYGAAREDARPPRRTGGGDAERNAASVGPRPETMVRLNTVKATPPLRKLAKDLGVDLIAVVPTGPDGVITRRDVLDASGHGEAMHVTHAQDGPADGSISPGTGDIRIPIKGVRKHTAAAVVASAFTAPHVTEFITLDITRTMELRDIVARRHEFRDLKLTPLALAARAFLLALGQTPEGNSRWDEENREIIQLTEVNLGIAAATPRGLVVPNIKSAQRLGLRDLAQAIGHLAERARAGTIPPEEMTDGTVTITNIGTFGVDTGTPILNPGEAAILAIGLAML